MLEVDGLTAHHGTGQVLHGVSLRVDAGECLVVLGRNGMGKTTLVHTIAGLHPASAGRVLLHGTDVTALPAEDRSDRGLALVPQGHRVFGSLSVRENLSVAARPGRWSLADVLARFPILSDRAHQAAVTLSGGQQQILALARAMAANPTVVLMDEPSEGLDPRRVDQVVRVVEDLVAAGGVVLLVEQRVSVALRVADRVAILERGAVERTMDAAAARGDPGELQRLLGLA